MAQKQVTQYFDDLDGRPLTEDEVKTVRFSVDGTDYVLEVSQGNADRFYEVISSYRDAAQRDHSRPNTRRARTGSNTGGIPAKRIREWAHANNIEVSDRGRLPQEIVDQYRRAGGQF
ncbi:Lsr2 family protein [Corynebacterium sp. 13CS0277]|uniref:histone-like nucleoid-structuring protein Lsr2 n=1 Tax=Corynebacterium sp. 13CS0277 TaxID=2071994 RepID=UPI000D040109|nr:Lsr2 family protein [Corynebacterium sp. 13CS0277]PRQ10468.1 Lsr2 family protein [Corynebacterium sp. 13CS0277]